MVYLWYPTETAGGPPADYLPGAQKMDHAPGTDPIKRLFGPLWPAVVSDAVGSPAVDHPSIAPGSTVFPLVLFVHGRGLPSFVYTSAIEDLVNHGYVVAAAEHPGSSPVVAFPDGHLAIAPVADSARATPSATSPASYDDQVRAAMIPLRAQTERLAADLRFVLDHVVAGDGIPFVRRLDLRRIAAVGHSMGGFAAVHACQVDPRIAACVNEDGGTPDGAYLEVPGAAPPLQPVLFVEASRPSLTDDQLASRGLSRTEWNARVDAAVAAQNRQLRQAGARSYKVDLLRVPGMTHVGLTDLPSLTATSGSEAGRRAADHLALRIGIVRTFLDEHLKGIRHELVAAQDHPDVVVTRFR